MKQHNKIVKILKKERRDTNRLSKAELRAVWFSEEGGYKISRRKVGAAYRAIDWIKVKEDTVGRTIKEMESKKNKTTKLYARLEGLLPLFVDEYNSAVATTVVMRDYNPKVWLAITEWLLDNPEYTPELAEAGKYFNPDPPMPPDCDTSSSSFTISIHTNPINNFARGERL